MQKGIDYIGVSVSFVCHDGKGNFLMNKRGVNARDEHGKWDFGGGGLELGEKIDECLEKEIKEEFGTEIIKYEFMGYLEMFRKMNDEDTHWLSLEFLVQINPEKVINGEPHKFDEIGWFGQSTNPASPCRTDDFTKVWR